MKRARHERGTEMNWMLCSWCFFPSLLPLHCEARRSISLAPSLSLAHLLTLFPSLKDWRGWFITVPCQKPFPQHDENNVPVIGIERHRLRDRSRPLLFSAPLKIGLHPWDHFKGFRTLTKSSCERWTTQTTVPCYAWTCSTTETIVLTIRLAFTMSTSPDRLVHIFLFSLLLLVPLRHPLLVLLFLSFFFFLSLISFFPFRLTLPQYLLSTKQSMWELNKYHHRSDLIHSHRQPLCYPYFCASILMHKTWFYLILFNTAFVT